LAAGDLAIQNVQKAGEENDQRASEEAADGKESGSAEIHNQSEKGEEIGIDAGGGDHPNNFIKQPFAAGSNCPC